MCPNRKPEYLGRDPERKLCKRVGNRVETCSWQERSRAEAWRQEWSPDSYNTFLREGD